MYLNIFVVGTAVTGGSRGWRIQLYSPPAHPPNRLSSKSCPLGRIASPPALPVYVRGSHPQNALSGELRAAIARRACVDPAPGPSGQTLELGPRGPLRAPIPRRPARSVRAWGVARRTAPWKGTVPLVRARRHNFYRQRLRLAEQTRLLDA